MKRPQVYGTDRVSRGPQGSLVLSCQHDKGWIARKPQTLIHAAFPGTCVRWNDQLFEVISIEVLEVGVRYQLRPWEDQHVVRVVEDYDAASEQDRAADRVEDQKRVAVRHISTAFALLIGNLPGEVQERMESEYGVPGTRLTLIALTPLFVIGTVSLLFLTAAFFGAPPVAPLPLLLAGSYFLPESLVRLDFAFRQSKPAGSILGVLPWFIYMALTGKVGRQPPRLDITPEPSVFQRDAYTIREPLLAFLTPPEQKLLAERYGFDPVRWGRRTAVFLILFATAGLATSVHGVFTNPYFGNFASLLAAGYLFAEQVARLRRAGRGEPAGSILGALVRPITKVLLR